MDTKESATVELGKAVAEPDNLYKELSARQLGRIIAEAQDLHKAVSNYLFRRAMAQATRERVDAVTVPILEKYQFQNDISVNKYGEEPKTILSTRHLYECSDEERINAFYIEVSNALREEGIKPPDMPDEHCPALTAEHEVTKAEWAICDEAAKVLEFDFDGQELISRLTSDGGMDKYNYFIEIVAKAVVNCPVKLG